MLNPLICFSPIMCLLVRIVRAFLHTAPDALFVASFVSSLKFTQFHCKQIRVFPLWFSVSAVFRSSCVHIRFFCGCTHHAFFEWYLGTTVPCIPLVCPHILYIRSFHLLRYSQLRVSGRSHAFLVAQATRQKQTRK